MEYLHCHYLCRYSLYNVSFVVHECTRVSYVREEGEGYRYVFRGWSASTCIAAHACNPPNNRAGIGGESVDIPPGIVQF